MEKARWSNASILLWIASTMRYEHISSGLGFKQLGMNSSSLMPWEHIINSVHPICVPTEPTMLPFLSAIWPPLICTHSPTFTQYIQLCFDSFQLLPQFPRLEPLSPTLTFPSLNIGCSLLQFAASSRDRLPEVPNPPHLSLSLTRSAFPCGPPVLPFQLLAVSSLTIQCT